MEGRFVSDFVRLALDAIQKSRETGNPTQAIRGKAHVYANKDRAMVRFKGENDQILIVADADGVATSIRRMSNSSNAFKTQFKELFHVEPEPELDQAE